jgi:hypothetical protein
MARLESCLAGRWLPAALFPATASMAPRQRSQDAMPSGQAMHAQRAQRAAVCVASPLKMIVGFCQAGSSAILRRTKKRMWAPRRAMKAARRDCGRGAEGQGRGGML